MKKKIAMLCVLVLTMGVLLACGGPSASPTEVATSFLTAIQGGDPETIANYYVDEEFPWEMELTDEDIDDMDEFEIELMEKMADLFLGFEFEITDEEIDGDTATVEVEITAYNISEMLENWMDAYFETAFSVEMADATDEEFEDLAIAYLENALAEVEKDFVTTVQLELVKVDGEWLVDEVEEEGELADAISGGFFSSEMGMW